MFYPNIYSGTNKRKTYRNKVQVLSSNSLSLEKTIANLQKEVKQLNQEVVELRLALAGIIDVLSDISFDVPITPPTKPLEPPVIEEPTEPSEPINEIQEIDVTEEFYTAINGILWLLN